MRLAQRIYERLHDVSHALGEVKDNVVGTGDPDDDTILNAVALHTGAPRDDVAALLYNLTETVLDGIEKGVPDVNAIAGGIAQAFLAGAFTHQELAAAERPA